MATSSGVPHLLSTYLQSPPEASLTVLTSVLDATTNWLVLRYLSVANQKTYSNETDKRTTSKIVFVSFLRDWDFWRDGARRLGLDLNQAVESGRIIYIDGLTKLFSTDTKSAVSAISAVSVSSDNQRYSILSSSFASIATRVSNILSDTVRGGGTNPLCIIDGLDFLLASTHISSAEMLNTLMVWRMLSYAMILAVSGDQPLIHTQQTPLETEHAAFVTGLVHQAYLVMSLRLLSTGAARDVSGVLRVSRGGSASDIEDGQVDEKEVLYFVGGDGGVKVFERGA